MVSQESVSTAGLTEEFDRHRGGLLAHCYQMVGSYHDAEDLVQKTYLHAVNGLDGFRTRSSLNPWLYRLATNICLDALAGKTRRVVPSGFRGPSADPDTPTSADHSTAWIEPLPHATLGADPVAMAALRDSLRIAVVIALQQLPARQRAVFLLREELAWPADEVAETLGLSVARVNSLLQRARSRVKEADSAASPEAAEVENELVHRFMRAFEISDIQALERLIHDQFQLEAPPSSVWFRGKAVCLPFLQRYVLGSPGTWRMRPARANGQPAAVAYRRVENGEGWRAFGLCVFSTRAGRIDRVIVFADPALADAAGAPPVLSDRATDSLGAEKQPGNPTAIRPNRHRQAAQLFR